MKLNLNTDLVYKLQLQAYENGKRLELYIEEILKKACDSYDQNHK